jgi:hypothetical protein
MSTQSLIWPNFYVVGAAKCGTTSVWAYLRKHPQVFLPELKEPAFFMTTPKPATRDRDFCAGNLEAYQRLYEDAKNYKAVGDASAGYLRDPNAPGRIHEVCPDARIVILLRDPVARAYSHFYMLQGKKKRSDLSSFVEAIQRDNSEIINVTNYNTLFPILFVEMGMYYEQVRRYIETFGRGQVAIYLSADLNKDTRGTMAAICRHIGVDPALLDTNELHRAHLAALVPRAKWLYSVAQVAFSRKLRQKLLPPRVRDWMSNTPLLYKRYAQVRDEKATRYLQSIYEPDLCRLEELLGRKLPELRSSWI